MKNRIIYTKYALKCFRITSIICALLLLAVLIRNILFTILPQLKENIPFSSVFIIEQLFNFIAFILFIFIIIFPQKFGLTSLIAFIYSFFIIVFEPENYMGLMMYFLGIITLLARGIIKRMTKKNAVLILTILFLLISTRLRFGIQFFLKTSLTEIGGLFVLTLFSFLMYAYIQRIIIIDDKKLYLSSYPKLTKRDFKILKKIQQGIKYSAIAKEFNLTEGALKNRLHFVFNTLEVGDRQGFLSIYEDYELIWPLEDVDKTEETTVS